jgi:hypothetical protein
LTQPAISDFDLHLFGEGNHQRIYDKLGAHPYSSGATSGTRFGSGYNGQSEVEASPASPVGHAQSLRLNLPPFGAVFFIGP